MSNLHKCMIFFKFTHNTFHIIFCFFFNDRSKDNQLDKYVDAPMFEMLGIIISDFRKIQIELANS